MLSPGGVLIPQCDAIRATVVEAPDFYRQHVVVWDRQARGFDVSQARHMSANTIYNSFRSHPGELLAPPGVLATLDYSQTTTTRLDARQSWTVMRPGPLTASACGSILP